MDSNPRSPVSGETPDGPVTRSPAITFRENSACASRRRLRPLRARVPPLGSAEREIGHFAENVRSDWILRSLAQRNHDQGAY
jgi:hypothetical protein